MTKAEITKLIRQKSLDIGFTDVGFSRVRVLSEEIDNYKRWLNNSYHADMEYLANNFYKRFDPSLLVDDAKTVISVIINYYPKELQNNDTYQVSKYAYGRDYHKVIKGKLKQLSKYINEEITPIKYRFFTDSAPVLDKKWAQLSGLGWTGKNSLLINKKMGSFFFIGELIIDLELDYGSPIKDACGTCTKCIDACPTDAIISDKIIDANKCISYLTIENKSEIGSIFTGNFNNNIFGCDICQDVCPWNSKAKPTNENDFSPKEDFLSLNNEDWAKLDKTTFDKIFNGTAVKRAKYEGLKRNINFISKKPQ